MFCHYIQSITEQLPILRSSQLEVGALVHGQNTTIASKKGPTLRFKL